MIITKVQLIWAVVLLAVIQPLALGYIAWKVGELTDAQSQASIVCGDLQAWTLHPGRG